MQTQSAEWVEERQNYIGGSDMGAIMGLCPWKSPYEVWRDKTGKTTPEEKHAVAELEQVQLGTLLEPKIAEMYTIRTGRKVARVNQPVMNPKYPDFMRGNIDRKIVGVDSLLECKNVGYHMAQKSFGEAGTDEVPEYQLIQVMYYLMLKEYAEGELAALLGGNTFRIFSIAADAELIELMRQAAEYFWTENVLKDIPPPASTYDDLKSMYSESRDGLPVIATDEIKVAAIRAAQLREAQRQAKKEEDALNIVVRNFMGEATQLITEDGLVLGTWKEQNAAARFNESAFKEAHPDLYDKFKPQPGSVGTIRVYRDHKDVKALI